MGILLDYHNRIIYETLLERLRAEKPESLDLRLADYDGVTYHISSLESKTVLRISMSIPCFHQLVKYGADDVLQREYGSLVARVPEPGHEVSLVVDLEQVRPEERENLAMSIALLKRNALAAPFEAALDAQSSGQTLPFMKIDYREEETIFIGAKPDRVTVIFQTTFKDDVDKVFGKVFLQEFVDARRQPAIQNAPQVLYSPKDPPLELRDVVSLESSEQIGFVTFVLFPRHFTGTPTKRDESVSRIQLFRDYLHYHIKCSKAYMHSRMRTRVDQFLKILNRAKPEVPDHLKEKKTASGRTFTRS